MQADVAFTEEQQKAAELIAKLLNLGRRNPNVEEAASALKRAADLALRHNLDMAAIGADADEGVRRKEKAGNGFYDHQQWIWNEVARLNFVMHFVTGGFEDVPRVETLWDGSKRRWNQQVWRKRHGLIGRAHNIATTKAMATYLEQAVERLVQEELEDRGLNPHTNRFSNWAVSFRKGAVLDICERLRERRKELEVAEEQKQAEARARAAAAGMSSGTSITIASLKQSEEDANRDVRFGLAPGTSARRRQESIADAQRRAEAEREAQEEWTRWAAAHPEEAARQEAERKREAEKREEREARRSRSAGHSYWKTVDWGAYSAGEKRGKTIGLDVQSDTGVGKGKGLGHG